MVHTAHPSPDDGTPADREDPDLIPHRVAVLADDTVVPFELAAVIHVLDSVGAAAGGPRYEVGVVGPDRPVAATSAGGSGRSTFSVLPQHALGWASTADTLVVPGHTSFVDVVPGEVEILIKEAASRGARLVALGLGTFALAAAGALDGRTATTHWYWIEELALRHPRAGIRREKLFVSDGSVHTAAGAASALDLILHLVERDHGTVLTSGAANHLIAPPRRDGGQAQYLAYETPTDKDPIREAMRWVEEHLGDDLTVSAIAGHAHMSTRNFTRRFRAATGATPLDWLLRVRVRRAQQLLETTTWSVEHVAHASGFGSPVTFRHHFARVVGTTPGRYRHRGAHTTTGRCA